MTIDCALGCGRPLNPHDIGVWKEVTGFVGGPKKDSMVLRTDTGRYAHNACVEKAKAGAAADQQEIFHQGASAPLPARENHDDMEMEFGPFDGIEEVVDE